MTIEIRDASLEARIQRQLQATGSSSVEGCCSACWKRLNDIVIHLKYNEAGAFSCLPTP